MCASGCLPSRLLRHTRQQGRPCGIISLSGEAPSAAARRLSGPAGTRDTHLGADRAHPASECATMPDQFLARLDQLSAAFARIEERAPWVRARFAVKAGKFTFFLLGRPLGV